MKNKKNIYILLPVVLFIWAAVMYQFFSFSGTDNENIYAKNELSLKPLKITERDTFSINVNYRDPFLGKIYAPHKNDSLKKNAVKTNKTPEIAEPLIWPSIVYKGMVSDTRNNTKIYMLLIGSQTFLMKKGETENEIFLKDGDRESIYVKYKGNLNLIMLQE